MITEDQLEELPEDDLEAFIALDAMLREEFKFGRTQKYEGRATICRLHVGFFGSAEHRLGRGRRGACERYRVQAFFRPTN
jgi:hypothetical protein